jgi:hypothetical protein
VQIAIRAAAGKDNEPVAAYSRQSERAVLTLCSTNLRPIVCWASING